MFYYRLQIGNPTETAVTNVATARGIVIAQNDAPSAVNIIYEVNNTPTDNGTQLFVKQAGALDLVIPTAFGVGYNINNLKISFTLRLNRC